MASIAELGLRSQSFSTSSPSRALVARRTGACALCLLAVCAAAVTLARVPTGPRLTLTENNQYEDSQSYHAEWDLKELHHHLVSTQRKMTTSNKEIEDGIKKLDKGVEILMHLIRHRPKGPAGEPGAAGKAGAKGPDGEKGKAGAAGADGTPGNQGVAGKDGVPGSPGMPGESGAAGQAGRPGNYGPPGAIGKPGPPGPPGQIGQQGRKGRHGWEGPPGPPGVPAYLHAVHHYPYEDTDTSGAEDASIDMEDKQEGGGSELRTQHRQQALARESGSSEGEVGAEDAYKRALKLKWERRGDVSVAQVPINGDRGYEVHVAGPRGDAIKASLRGQDGFAKSWKGTSSLVSGAIAAGAPGSDDFLKVTDETRYETQYFRLPANQ